MSEEDPLPSEEVGPKMRGMVEALRRVEDVVGKSGGATLRYGAFYGRGANEDLLELVRKGGSRLSGTAPATSIRAPRRRGKCHRPGRWSSRRRAYSTSSTTSLPRFETGCRISPKVRG